MPDYQPDEDEGDVRFDMVEIALVLALLAVVAPGLLWWIGQLIEMGRLTPEAFR